MKARTKTGEPWFFKPQAKCTRCSTLFDGMSKLECDWDYARSDKCLNELIRYLKEKLCGTHMDLEIEFYEKIHGEIIFLQTIPIPYDFSVEVLLPWIVSWNKRYKRARRNMPFILNFQKCTTIVIPLTKKGN